MQLKIDAIVIKAINYKDNDKILTLFSKQNGLVTAGIKGVRKATAKLKFSAMPFCFAEYLINSKNNFNTVIGASSINNYFDIRQDIFSYYSASVMLEFVSQTVFENLPNEQLFDCLNNSLLNLCLNITNQTVDSKTYAKLLLVKFLINALNFSGWAINLNSCAVCSCQIENQVFLSTDNGGVVCKNCLHENDTEFNLSTYNALLDIANSNFCNLCSLSIAQPCLDRCLKLLIYFMQTNCHIKLDIITQFLAL